MALTRSGSNLLVHFACSPADGTGTRSTCVELDFARFAFFWDGGCRDCMLGKGGPGRMCIFMRMLCCNFSILKR